MSSYLISPIKIGQNHVRPEETISGIITAAGEISTNPSNSNGQFATAKLDQNNNLYIKGNSNYGGNGQDEYEFYLADVQELHVVAEGTFIALTSTGILKSYGNWSGVEQIL